MMSKMIGNYLITLILW